MLRALALDHPADPACWRVADQYRLGRDLLVTPVVDEGATTRRLYLPPGDWYDLWSGAALAGGGWAEVDAPIERIPVFVRAGAILPLQLGPGQRLGDDVGGGVEPAHLTLRVFPGSGGGADLVLRGERYRLEVSGAGGARRLLLPALPIPATVLLPDGSTVEVAAGEARAVVLS
jgi:alpha-glucosidase (family GH31 glycosyl hydrolase)